MYLIGYLFYTNVMLIVIGILMYKLSIGLLPQALNELYVKNNEIHHYPTRNCELRKTFLKVITREKPIRSNYYHNNIVSAQYYINFNVYAHGRR